MPQFNFSVQQSTATNNLYITDPALPQLTNRVCNRKKGGIWWLQVVWRRWYDTCLCCKIQALLGFKFWPWLALVVFSWRDSTSSPGAEYQTTTKIHIVIINLNDNAKTLTGTHTKQTATTSFHGTGRLLHIHIHDHQQNIKTYHGITLWPGSKENSQLSNSCHLQHGLLKRGLPQQQVECLYTHPPEQNQKIKSFSLISNQEIRQHQEKESAIHIMAWWIDPPTRYQAWLYSPLTPFLDHQTLQFSTPILRIDQISSLGIYNYPLL